ncbi:hypothetical protein GCM10010363_60530 [Streptomyces omiyaensis]|uniref:hypothetical protein n=1 Tax=Streptomyces omiyaensis TaxID=68247 RepID=UPI001672895F|nr:hypothetical protein [Streptomyces omiyaensis]GGY71216.1 hypothetical protein GCM10010363_60530 [Streptomyces omiyaensis]
MRGRDASDVGAHWLADARPDNPFLVWRDWEEHAHAILPTGTAWDVIAVPRERCIAAARRHPELWSGVPVLEDQAADFAYVWVPAGTASTWQVPGTVALGLPWFVAVPRPGGPQVPERRWAQPPGLTPRLMDPDDLRTALKAAWARGEGREDT